MPASTSATPSPSKIRWLTPPSVSLQPRQTWPKPRTDTCAALGIFWSPHNSPQPADPGPPAKAPGAPLQHAPDPRKGGFECGFVMDDREANIPAAGIVPAIGCPRGITAGQHPDRRVAPQPHG